MKALVVLRGLPGSGKSTLAKILSEYEKYPVFSIDDYFTDKITGAYQFNPFENFKAYSHCEMRTQQAMEADTEKIFLDNVFSLSWEIEPYFIMANKFNYKIFVATIENYHHGKNEHGVNQEQLLKMAAKYKVQLL